MDFYIKIDEYTFGLLQNHFLNLGYDNLDYFILSATTERHNLIGISKYILYPTDSVLLHVDTDRKLIDCVDSHMYTYAV